jgi:hypothetical protein
MQFATMIQCGPANPERLVPASNPQATVAEPKGSEMNVARSPSTVIAAGAAVLFALAGLQSSYAHAEDWGANQIKGSGVVRTETRAVADFQKITLGVGAHLEIRQGTSEGLTITGDDNIVPLIESVVDHGALKIRWASKGRVSTSYKRLDIVVYVKAVESLTISGSGEMHAERLKAADLKATISGSGEITIDALDATSLNLSLAGSGTMTAAGQVNSLDATISGSGELAAAKLESRNARVTMQGSGDVAIWAKDTLSATIAGSGEIKYYGKPQVTRTVAGSGSVTRAGDAS